MKHGGVYEMREGARIAGYRVVWFDWTGKRHERKCRGFAKRDADTLWRDLTVQAQRERAGGIKPAERVTLAEFAEKHYFPDQEHRVRRSTFEKQESVYALHIAPRLGKLHLAALTPDVISKWLGGLHSHALYEPAQRALAPELAPAPKKRPPRRALAPATLRLVERTLTAIVNRAGRDGFFGDPYTYRKPWAGVKPPRAPRVERPRIDGAEGFSRFIEAALREGGREVALAVVLGLYAGLRRGEMPMMRWGEELRLDADARTVDITVPGDRAKDKEDRSMRIARADLFRLFAEQHAAAVACESPFVFFHARDIFNRGRLVAARGSVKREVIDERRWARIKAAAGVSPRLRVHDLRASFLCALLDAGVSPLDVQKQAGHSSFETTRTYLARVKRPDVDASAAALACHETIAPLQAQEG